VNFGLKLRTHISGVADSVVVVVVVVVVVLVVLLVVVETKVVVDAMVVVVSDKVIVVPGSKSSRSGKYSRPSSDVIVVAVASDEAILTRDVNLFI